jgi:hypothetical protein
VAVGEQFKLTYTLEAQGSSFRAPTFTHFRILSGPNQSSSMSWVNGQMSSSISYSYILSPLKPGKFTFSPAIITVAGKQISSNEVSLEVTPAKVQAPSNASGEEQPQQGGQAVSDNVFIRCIPSRSKVFLGEQLICEYKIYTRLQILDNAVEQLPSFNGFFMQEQKLSNAEMSLKPEVYNGVQFQVATIKRVLLSPQRSGDLAIDKLSMDLVLRIQDNRRQRSIFDQFFGTYQDVRYKAISNPVTVKVLPLPEAGKPKDFKGAVGKFGFMAEIDRENVNVNDAINLKINFSGTGDLKLLEAPEIAFPSDFEVYDPKINTDLNAGRKTVEYLIIPRAAGDFEIPVLTFSYFDPNTGKYVSQKAGPFGIKVNKSKDSDPVASVNRVTKKEVNLLGRDIRFIKTSENTLNETRSYFFGTPVFYGLALLPIALLLISFVIVKQREKRNSDPARLKKRGAGKVASRRLAKASTLLRENNMAGFYEELLESIQGYLSDKLLIPMGEMQRERITAEFDSAKIPQELQLRVFSLIDECEMARFAPVMGLDAEKMYEKAGSIIGELEEVLP